MRALFDGLGEAGKDAWGPSKEWLPINVARYASQVHIDLESKALVSPFSPNEEIKPNVKSCKKESFI